jgi:hypothetical protein
MKLNLYTLLTLSKQGVFSSLILGNVPLGSVGIGEIRGEEKGI